MLNVRLTAIAAAATLLAACATPNAPVALPASDAPQAINGYDTNGAPMPGAPLAAPATGAAMPVGGGMAGPGSKSFPITAKAGECYARVVTPPRFENKSEKMLAKAESEKIEVIPAKFDYVEDKVMVKPAGKKVVEIIPAVYKTVEEAVLVKPASEKLEQVPAVYRDVEEQQLLRPATTMWKKGRGPTEKFDGLTGEIMCLVNVPAEYRTVKKRVVEKAPEVKRIPVPAEYATIKRQELLKPAEVKEIDTPAEYKTVRILKLVTPSQEKRIPIPAEYQTITSQTLVSEGTAEWKSILCQTNTTPGTVTQIQRALLAKGFNPGKIDGVVGAETMTAVRAFQTANGLSSGGLTMETIDKLGVSVGKAS